MIAIIFFLFSLFGSVGMIYMKSIESKTGKENYLTKLEFWADKFIASRFVHTKELFLSLVIEGFRGTALFFLDIVTDAGRLIVGVWRKTSHKLSVFMRERKLRSDTAMSMFLRTVLEHKETLKNER